MSCPSSSTRPRTVARSESSCMRLRQRRNVLLPHPDGPMMAVTVLAGNAREMFLTAAVLPKNAERYCAASLVGRSAGSIASTRDPARGHAEHKYESHQDQCGRPREPMPFVVRTGGVHEDLQRQGLHRLSD